MQTGSILERDQTKALMKREGGGSVSTGDDKGPKPKLVRDKRRDGDNFCGQRGDKNRGNDKKNEKQGKNRLQMIELC